MKKQLLSALVAASMCVTLFTACSTDKSKSKETAKDNEATTTKVESKATEAEAKDNAEVLEFYHGYYQEKSEWAAAQVMRDIYDDFAKQHANDKVKFKAIPVENRDEIVSAKVAGGSFPDVVDVGGGGVPQAAIAQKLVYDLKPYIDENKLQAAVGLNYTQHNIDGHIYAIHDQIESRGLWYNAAIFKQAGLSENALKSWDEFAKALPKISALKDGIYAYIAGQGSSYIVNSMMAASENGKKMIETALTKETINSEEFAKAFKTAAKLDQANGSEHTTNDTGNLMAEFNKNGKVGVLFNGVWNASGIDEKLVDAIEPALFPGDVAIASAGGGLAISNNMSEEKTKLALEFIKYMTSVEVQEKIFTGVQANPCNTTIDLKALAEKSGNAATVKLAKACSQVNAAKTVVIDLNYTWGHDVDKAIINALMECAVSGTDIDTRFTSLQKELLALIA